MRSRWLGFFVAAVALGFSAWAFAKLPASVATHFDVHGVPDGYSPRWVAAGLLPLIVLGLRMLSAVFPRIDPKSPNYEKFIETYWLLINSILVFLAVVHVVVIAYALEWPIPINRVIPIGVGLLFLVIGNYLGQVEPNWFLGVRTPWTLSSDRVWRKTNRTAGWLMVTAGGLFIVSAFVPAVAVVPLFISTVAVVAVIPIVQSYVLWKREQSASH